MTDVSDLIARRLAAPKNYRVTTIYEGRENATHDTETYEQAANWAEGESRKVGRQFIDRETGKPFTVLDVAIEPLG